MNTTFLLNASQKKKVSKHFCFETFVFCGSPSWTRTSDLRINSPSLYRLSYQGIDAIIANRLSPFPFDETLFTQPDLYPQSLEYCWF